MSRCLRVGEPVTTIRNQLRNAMPPHHIARGFSAMWSAFLVLLYAACAVFTLWLDGSEINVALRGGIAAFFAGRALASLLLLVARLRSGVMDPERLLRSYLVLSYAYIASGILIGAGALWYGGILGFAGAYAAFSFVWIWFWIRGTLSAARSGT